MFNILGWRLRFEYNPPVFSFKRSKYNIEYSIVHVWLFLQSVLSIAVHVHGLLKTGNFNWLSGGGGTPASEGKYQLNYQLF